MLTKLLHKSDWAFLLDFVSPAFFKVIPPLELLHNATALAKRSQDVALYRKSLDVFSVQGQELFSELVLYEGQMNRRGFDCQSFSVANESLDVKKLLASRIVELYFAQLYLNNPFLLDLRMSRFAHLNGQILWSPAPLLGVFSPEFLKSMCRLYEGYYKSQHEQMKAALRDLNLDWAFDVFIHHFGEGDQTSVQFSVSHFVHTFHEIFLRCKEEKKSLRGEFVQLGVVLGLMYETLESIGVAVDVRSAFLRVSR